MVQRYQCIDEEALFKPRAKAFKVTATACWRKAITIKEIWDQKGYLILLLYCMNAEAKKEHDE